MELGLSQCKMAWANPECLGQVDKGMLYTWLMQDNDMRVLCDSTCKLLLKVARIDATMAHDRFLAVTYSRVWQIDNL
jgi:hypothetical protein